MTFATRRAVVVAAFLLFTVLAKASATCPIIVLDRATNKIGVAAASSSCGAQRATTGFLAVAKPGDVPN